MILEGVVTTLSRADVLNIAPMGADVDPGPAFDRFVLRPYRTSTTYANLKDRGEGVLHVTDDVLLIARAAIGVPLSPFPDMHPASVVDGMILSDACRHYEFRVAELDDRDERTTVIGETVARGRHRDCFGFNRAKHAVLEAAILATRTAWLPLRDLIVEFRKLEILVTKTGGPAEHEAFQVLQDYLREAAVAQGLDPDLRPSPP